MNNFDFILMVIFALLTLIVGFSVVIKVLYDRMIKNKRRYTCKKALNGDIRLDDVCKHNLVLTNVHVPDGHKMGG